MQVVFGCLAFVKQLQFQQYDLASLNDAIQTEDGGYMVVGTLNTTSDNATLLIKLNATGDTTWTNIFSSNFSYSIQKATPGYIITGTSTFNSRNYILVSCFAQNGNDLWS